jgi:hypothetical protein
MATKAPRVFISYSHDNEGHKTWVRTLAGRLREVGIDAIIDHYQAALGCDLAKFMESIGTSDRVLVICTGKYVEKFNKRKGGVGYEALMVTAELLNAHTDKFIPVIRQPGVDSGMYVRPAPLMTRKYIDMSEDVSFEAKVDELAREIHRAPEHPIPPLGPNPYAKRPDDDPSGNGDPLTIFRQAESLAKQDDSVGLRRLANNLGTRAKGECQAWHNRWDPKIDAGSYDQLALEREGLTVYAPLISYAMAVWPQATRNRGSNAIDEIMQSGPRGRYTSIVRFYETALHYLQSLLGSYALHVADVPGAREAALTVARGPEGGFSGALWTAHVTPGSSAAAPFAHYERLMEWFDWLETIYGTRDEFIQAMYAYQMLRNLVHFADFVDNKSSSEDYFYFSAYPLFLDSDNPTLASRAYRLLTVSPVELANIWRRKGLPDDTVFEKWPGWILDCKKQINHPLPHEQLMEDMRKALT